MYNWPKKNRQYVVFDKDSVSNNAESWQIPHQAAKTNCRFCLASKIVSGAYLIWLLTIDVGVLTKYRNIK